ncbi:MAG: hypothetical protein RMJ37_07280, partial [Spirochaetia bacterium]|nr:hypothetical protein [Spirochaetota bacterium]MDW8113115.1 hypothetical protein [Spirochaetia bacterium]
ITLALLLVSTISGILIVVFRKLRKIKVRGIYRKALTVIHVISSILALASFLLTYFLAPKI